MRPRLFVAVLCLLVPALALGQCPGGQCPGGMCPVQQLQPAFLPSAVQQPAACPYPAMVKVAFVYPDKSGMECGSGTIVDRLKDTAIVLTCAHGYKALMTVRVELQDGRRYDASILGVDSVNDLCIVAIRDPGVQPMQIADAPPTAGDKLFAAGFSGGQRYMGTWGTLSGWVSPARDGGQTFLQTTCRTEQGCSGGPILDSTGRLVGTVTGSISGAFGPCLAKTLPKLTVARLPYQTSPYAAEALPWRRKMDAGQRAINEKVTQIGVAVTRPIVPVPRPIVPVPQPIAPVSPVPQVPTPAVDLSPILQGQQEQAELLRSGFAELSTALAEKAKADAKPETLKEKIHDKLEADAEEGGLKGKIAEKLLRWEERGSTALWIGIAVGVVLLVYWHKNKHGPVAGLMERVGGPELAEREEAIVAKVEARVKGAVATAATANPVVGLAVTEAEKVERRIKDLIEARLAPSPAQSAAPPVQSTLVPPSAIK